MVISFVVNDIYSTAYILNTFSHVIDGYVLERNPMTGEIELVVLFIEQGKENEAKELKELVELEAKRRH